MLNKFRTAALLLCSSLAALAGCTTTATQNQATLTSAAAAANTVDNIKVVEGGNNHSTYVQYSTTYPDIQGKPVKSVYEGRFDLNGNYQGTLVTNEGLLIASSGTHNGGQPTIQKVAILSGYQAKYTDIAIVQSTGAGNGGLAAAQIMATQAGKMAFEHSGRRANAAADSLCTLEARVNPNADYGKVRTASGWYTINSGRIFGNIDGDKTIDVVGYSTPLDGSVVEPTSVRVTSPSEGKSVFTQFRTQGWGITTQINNAQPTYGIPVDMKKYLGDAIEASRKVRNCTVNATPGVRTPSNWPWYSYRDFGYTLGQ